MDAGFVCESVLADNRFVRLGSERDQRRQQLAARIEMLGHDASFERKLIAARVERHHDFFQRCISGSLADPVDGAFDLARSALDRRQ